MQGIYLQSDGVDIENIGLSSDLDGCYKVMSGYLDRKNIKSPYFRQWGDEKQQTIDFGSWSEFIVFRKEEVE